MTANAIVMKLNRLLDDPIDSECKALYLLAEVRKLLEPTPQRQRPFALDMYCHWALHVKLDRNKSVPRFLQLVDDYVDSVVVRSEDIDASTRTDRESFIVREFLMLDTLRSQMRNFCVANDIRTDLTDTDDRWHEFVRHYAGVIEDDSLTLEDENHRLTHVKQVTFRKGRDAVDECALFPFEMLWHVERWNGRPLHINVKARMNSTGQIIPGWGVGLGS